MRSNPGEIAKLLTETELELMFILWSLEGGTVSDVQSALPKKRPLAYTSISTILRILEKKGVLAIRKEGRGHVYIPVFSREEYESRALRDMVNRVFQGETTALVKQFLSTTDLTEGELNAIRALLKKDLP
jgi:predicted transcriptional regulator